jgi:2-oxoglutarate dehydrogenase complex dehydrogenase (E1) component-like enzyme
MTIAVPTTPGNYFHLLRHHVLDDEHRPLVVFTPKSMLRLKAATSRLSDFTDVGWQPVLADPDGPDAGNVRRVVLCSGKVYYDLHAARAKNDVGDVGDVGDVAIVRVEQLYPLAATEILEALSRYPNADEVVWVQEEPANQGGWPFMALHLPEHLGERHLRRVSRPSSAAPAGGSSAKHDAEQAALVHEALGLS